MMDGRIRIGATGRVVIDSMTQNSRMCIEVIDGHAVRFWYGTELIARADLQPDGDRASIYFEPMVDREDVQVTRSKAVWVRYMGKEEEEEIIYHDRQ